MIHGRSLISKPVLYSTFNGPNPGLCLTHLRDLLASTKPPYPEEIAPAGLLVLTGDTLSTTGEASDRASVTPNLSQKGPSTRCPVIW